MTGAPVLEMSEGGTSGVLNPAVTAGGDPTPAELAELERSNLRRIRPDLAAEFAHLKEMLVDTAHDAPDTSLDRIERAIPARASLGHSVPNPAVRPSQRTRLRETPSNTGGEKGRVLALIQFAVTDPRQLLGWSVSSRLPMLTTSSIE
jgi:hypothetical protein